jgi:hypothetical protein
LTDRTDRTDRTEETEKTEKESNLKSQEKKNLVLEQINQLYLEFCIILLNYKLKDNKYKSIVINILAILRF